MSVVSIIEYISVIDIGDIGKPRVFRRQDFLVFILFSYYHQTTQSPLLVYEYTYLFLLANKQDVVDQFLQRLDGGQDPP